MKNLKIIFILFLFQYATIISQNQDYSVKLRIGQITFTNYDEWNLKYLNTDIFDSEDKILQPSSNYYYLYEKDVCDGNGFQYWTAGNGFNELNPDGHRYENSPCDREIDFQTYWVRVKVTINGNDYFSRIVRVPDDGSGVLTQKQINVTQKRENQSIVENIGKKEGTEIYNYPAPMTFYKPSTVNSEIFKGTQELVSNPYEKYNRWSGISDVVNHRSFTLSGSIINLTSRNLEKYTMQPYKQLLWKCPAYMVKFNLWIRGSLMTILII